MLQRAFTERGIRSLARRMAPRVGTTGLTLVELIVAFSLLLTLSLIALPVAHIKVKRAKEQRLREALHEMRTAIDRHKDMADNGILGNLLNPNNHGYPESLELLVDGVEPSQNTGGLSVMQSQSGLRESADTGFGGWQQQQRGRLGQSRTGASLGTSGSVGDPRNTYDESSYDEDDSNTVRFLRKIPVDPITGRAEWGLRSLTDDPGSNSWGGRNVFDVYSLSNDIALDGSRYSEW